VKFVRYFSHVYRFVLQSSQQDLVPLQAELKFINAYWNLLKMRHQKGIELVVQIDQEKMHKLIPPLSLQLVVENAIKHNKITTENPLRINLYNQENTLVIENQLIPKASLVKGEGVGLQNLKMRFELIVEQPITFGEEDRTYKVTLPLK